MHDEAFLESLDRYTVLRRLGAGGMGVVYQVFDRERNTVVALKMMQRYDPASLYRFKREFRTLADVKHRNLVALHELSAHDDRWYFTMEYVEGCSFLDYVREHPSDTTPDSTPTVTSGRPEDAASRMVGASVRDAIHTVTLDRLRPALAQLGHAVQALHERGHLHRDIKPSNVLVTAQGRVVLLDFGLITTVENTAGRQTVGGLVVGTPAYMSPEQTVGGQLSPASDWYSVGAILYEVLTARFPFQPGPGAAIDLMTLVDRKRSGEAPLASTLAADVPADLDLLCRDLLRRDPAARLPGPELLQRLRGSAGDIGEMATEAIEPARSLLVGRDDDLDTLHDALRRATAGALAVVHVHGSSGIGKSALVRHFLDRSEEARRALLFEGRCYEQESLPHKALDSIVDAISQYLASLDESALARMLPPAVSELARMFPVLERIEPIANAVGSAQRPIDPQSRRRIAFTALRELLTRIARERPLIVYVDDLQWGDVDSAVALDELLRPPDPPPLLFIGCFRSEDAKSSEFLRHHVEAMRKLSGSVFYRALALGPLSAAEAARLATALLGGQPAVDSGALVAEAHGHPYFLKELVHYHRAPSTSATGSTPSGVVTLSGVLSRRIRRLPEDCQRVLEVVAAAGHPIDQRVAIDASVVGAVAPDALERLRTEKLIRSRSIGGRSFVEPYHDQIRENAVRPLRPEEQRDVHGRLAAALESVGGADPEQLALHFEAAGLPAKAARYAEAAADAAMELLAFDWAAELYSRSHRLVGPDQERRQRLSVKAAEAYTNAGRGADAATRFLEAARGVPSTAVGLDYQRRAAEQLLGSGRIDDGIAVLRDVLASVGIEYPRTAKRALAGLLLRRALIRLRGIGYRRRREDELSPDTRARLDICRTAAEGLAMVDTIRGAHFQARGLLMTLAAGEPARVSLALSLESGFVATAGRAGRARADALASRAMTLAVETGHPYALGRAVIARGLAHYLVGEWRRAVVECGNAVAILRDRCVGVRWALSTAQRFEIGGLHYLGELREIADRVPVLLEDARRRGDLYLATELNTRDSHLSLLAADIPDVELANIKHAMDQWSRHSFHLQHYNAMLAAAHCHLYKGDAAEAWRAVSAAWPPLGASMLMRVQVLRAEALFLYARTLLHGALLTGDWRTLPEIERHAARLRRERMPWCDALALMLEASIAAARRQPREVDAKLQRAADAADATGMALYAACVRQVIGRLGRADNAATAAAAAREWMASQQVQQPEAMASLFVPMPWRELTGAPRP